MSAPAGCQLVGRWRIVEADLWDRDYLDLCGPAAIVIGAEGRGEIAFGAMQATLDIEYSRSSIGFAWTGFDEGDEISGEGTAKLLDDGFFEIVRVSQRRRRRPQSEARDFFNSLLDRSRSSVSAGRLGA